MADLPIAETVERQDKAQPIRSRLQLVLTVVSVLICAVQLIAIYTPGWLITSAEEQSTGSVVQVYSSLYYAVMCLTANGERECASKSYLDDFHASLSDNNEFIYNRDIVLVALNAQLSWLILVGNAVLQVLKYVRHTEKYPRLTVIAAVFVTGTSVAMYQVLFTFFNRITLANRDEDNTVGFPYSFFLYCLTFVPTLTCVVLMTKQTFDHSREQVTLLAQEKVKFDTLKKHYDAEVEDFRRYRARHRDSHHLRPRSGSPRDRPGSREGSPGSHDRPLRPRSRSPRPSENRPGENDRASPRHDQTSRPRDHSPRPRDHSPRHDQTSRPRDHSPRRRDHSPRRSDRSPPGERQSRSRQRHNGEEPEDSSNDRRNPSPVDKDTDLCDQQSPLLPVVTLLQPIDAKISSKGEPEEIALSAKI